MAKGSDHGVSRAADATARPEIIPDLRRGRYSDGHPFDEVQYLECKIILKPDRFTSAKAFLEYGELVRRGAEAFGIHLDSKGVVPKPKLREVVFYDTSDFRLYSHAFILRRRIAYEDGFPAGEPEIVFKFRHPDIQKAAELDIRPNWVGNYRIKFKAETLPLKAKPGGYRTPFSHNVQFPPSKAPEGDRLSMLAVATVFPCLAPLKKSETDRLELVNATHVEEVLQDLGTLDFGKGVTADANAAIWRERGTYNTLCGEFAYQAKFKRRDELHEKAMERCRQFFISLQQIGRDWLSLGSPRPESFIG